LISGNYFLSKKCAVGVYKKYGKRGLI
jgi:hypothetical protein